MTTGSKKRFNKRVDFEQIYSFIESMGGEDKI